MGILDSKAPSNLLPVRPLDLSTVSAERPQSGGKMEGLELKAERDGLAEDVKDHEAEATILNMAKLSFYRSVKPL
jgi:hypothetical protein